MMQGDSYGIPINLLKKDGTLVDTTIAADVEIAIGSLIKTYSSGKVKYADGQWIFPLSQEESFKLPSGHVKAQVRVEFQDGSIEGVPLGEICVQESISKVVL